MMKKINKKGQFFSLLVVIVIILLAIFFFYRADAATKENDLYIKRVTISNVDNFVTEFETTAIPIILETAAKPAISERISKPAAFNKFTKGELVEIMKDGVHGGKTYLADYLTTNNARDQTLGTLTYTLENEFEYILEEVRQPDFDTLELEFVVSYKFESFENKWENTDKHVILEIPIYGLRHPAHERHLITDDWELDNSGNCFSEQIFSDAEACSNKNIRPEVIGP